MKKILQTSTLLISLFLVIKVVQADDYACTFDQLPAELVTLIQSDPNEMAAWDTRDPEDTCDLRNYGFDNLQYFRFSSLEVRDELNGSVWHRYQSCKTGKPWKHVATWDC